jgi:nucleoside-diphosphate-sugar epimerase
MKGPLLLTGASGWFGRTALWEYEQVHGPEALRRDVIPFASRVRLVDFDSPHGPLKALPLKEITAVPNPRGLLHLAFLTRDKVEELGWRRYVDSNWAITATVAEVLRMWPNMPVVATSSGAAAVLDGQHSDLEGNPYATLKKQEEVLLEQESATRMAMVFRVYAATGRFMTRPEKFALGDFLLQAIRGERIRIRAKGLVLRSYVHAGQLMQLAWHLLRQENVHGFRLFDACTNTLILQELATLIQPGVGHDQITESSLASVSSDVYRGDGRRFARLLAEAGLSAPSMRVQIEDTRLSLKVSTDA